MSNCSIAEDSTIENSIIGHNVRVEKNVKLDNVVIADGVTITTSLPAGAKIGDNGQIL